jgi:preprotein translocase subunit SecF
MINFLKYKWLYLLISALVIGLGLYSILTYGFLLSIDFIGGSVIEYHFDKQIKKEDLRKIFENNKIKIFSFQTPTDKSVMLKTAPVDENKQRIIREVLENTYKVKITTLRFETVGPTLGAETTVKTIIASVVAIFGILVYLTFAFKNVKYGVAAILAMIHDFIVVIGSYSLMSKFFGAEVDTLFVTALLTTMSFSVHDTIVVFDKIREYRRIDTVTPFNILANKALTETMVRSLNNSLTIILMLLALVLLGGDTIKFFAATLLIGTVTGTYSSPFIATPILEFFEKGRIAAKS